MTLIRCPGCGRQRSDILKLCPYCGSRLTGGEVGGAKIRKKKDGASFSDWVKLIFAAGAVAVALYFFGDALFAAFGSAASALYSMVRDVISIIRGL